MVTLPQLPDPSAIEALAARVEQASGPDREIDAAIHMAATVGKDWTRNDPAAARVWALHYTASLDAAMSLVPAGFHWQVGIGVEGSDEYVDRAYAWCSDEPTGELCCAATPALALVSASLRALASSIREGGEG